MLRITCDVTQIPLDKVLRYLPRKGSISFIAQKYNTVLKYKNCHSCYTYGPSLTSTAVQMLSFTVDDIISRWNRNILNPKNKKYHEAYKSLLNENLDINSIKFIALFETDDGFLSTLTNQEWTHIFEAIIDTQQPIVSPAPNENGYITGYDTSYEFISTIGVMNNTHNTFITPYMLNKISKYKYRMNPTALSYFLRNQEITKCIKNSQGESSYMGFIQMDLTKRLVHELCKEIKTSGNHKCKMEDIVKAIDYKCNNDSSLTLVDNEVTSITCYDNYEHYLTTYEEQQSPETQFHTAASSEYYSYHDNIA